MQAEIVYPYGTNIWRKTTKKTKRSKAYRDVKRRVKLVQKAIKEGKDPKEVLANDAKSAETRKSVRKAKKKSKNKNSKSQNKPIEGEIRKEEDK
jgi:hypothetical protein